MLKFLSKPVINTIDITLLSVVQILLFKELYLIAGCIFIVGVVISTATQSNYWK